MKKLKLWKYGKSVWISIRRVNIEWTENGSCLVSSNLFDIDERERETTSYEPPFSIRFLKDVVYKTNCWLLEKILVCIACMI